MTIIVKRTPKYNRHENTLRRSFSRTRVRISDIYRVLEGTVDPQALDQKENLENFPGRGKISPRQRGGR